ncbi:MAG TPA: hypothetical protein VFI96_03985 [Longimicrobiaceae bacterium]|nr:hypothetical protein [Longimicrobiaceae bacterium]
MEEQITSRERTIAWLLIGIAIVVNAAGYLFDLWATPVWYDEAVHGFTTLSITLLIGLYLYDVVYRGADDHFLLLVLVIASVGLAIGAVWEVFEWADDQFVTPGNSILGKWDTITDLVVDTLGALVGGAIAAFWARR